jgi:hypothetical protein
LKVPIAQSSSPKVFDDQVIVQAIKALRAGPLHNHLVRERPKIVLELYGQFAKFSKSEIQHFCKLEQQRKVSKPDETPRPDTMTINEATPSMYTTLTLMAVGHQKARKRTLDHLRRKETQEFSTKDTPSTVKEVEPQIVAVGTVETHTQ